MKHTLESIWHKTWKDKDGRTVLWQTPNMWLLSWLVFTTVSLFISGRTADLLSRLGSAALIVWALLEIFKGVNYFRRGMGLLIFVFSISSFIRSF
jgi:hypothetical protein